MKWQTINRLGITLWMCLVTNAIYATSTKYETVRAKTDPTSMKGVIYMSTSDDENYKYDDDGVMETSVSSKGIEGVYILPVTIYLYADEEGVPNAIWGGWYNNGALLQEGLSEISVAVTPSNGSEQPSVGQYEYIAKWVQPKVESNDNDDVTDLGVIHAKTEDVISKTVKYDIKEYTRTEHFKVEPASVNSFTISLDEVTESDADMEGTATISIDYIPTGIHGEKTGVSYIASALYNGDYTEEGSEFFQLINFRITEDYTPNFEVKHNTESNTFSIGTTNVGGTIESAIESTEVYNKNYAASADKFSGIGPKQHKTIWKASIEGEESGYEGLFTIIDGDDTETPTIQFNATDSKFPLSTGESKTVTAQVKLSCTYYDESNPAAEVPMEDPQYIYISATVVQSNTATLLFGESESAKLESLDFDDQPIGGDAEEYVPFIAFNVENLQAPIIDGDHKKYFEASVTGQRMKISIKKDATIPCGELNATVTLRGTSKLDHTTSLSATLNLTANMYLSAPQVEAVGGDRTIIFQWEPVFGATSYLVYEEANSTNPKYTITDATQYVETVATNGTEKTYYFTAKNASGCESQRMGPITGEAELQYITKANAHATGLQTGTAAKQAGGFPWHAIRNIDVSAAFDADGNPIFDELHIFALSTGETEAKLTTPCYKYIRDAVNKRYQLDSEINEKKGNTTKHSIYKFDNITGNKKVYLTGYRPYATTGSIADEGVFFFKGGNNAVLDLYLDNCEIYAQAKVIGTTTINTVGSEGYFAKGSGSVFAIQTTSSTALYPFYVNIHLNGTNILDAFEGTELELYISKSSASITDKDITHPSSPIAIIPNSTSDAVALTIDDVWPTEEHANGSLMLTESNDNSDVNTPYASIDLGNSKTRLSINGGQIIFMETASCFQTTTYSKAQGDVTLSFDAYGIGTTNNTYKKSISKQVNNTVNLLDGTLNGSTTNVTFYTNQLLIDGGTYNVTPKYITAERGEQTTLYNSNLKELQAFEIANTDNKYWGTLINGRADLTASFSSMVDDLFPNAGVNGEFLNGSYHYPLSSYYVDGKSYGHASLAPKDNKIKLYLPKLDCNSVNFVWQICAPSFMVDVEGRKYAIQDKVIDACPQHPTEKYSTDYMLYMQADQYVMNVMGEEYFRPMNLGYAEIRIDSEDNNLSSFVNIENNYTINRKVYMLMPIEAAKWTLFTPPFDVANVYLIESYPEEQLIKDYGGKRGKVPVQYIEAARNAQAQRMVDLYTMWYFEGKGLDGVYDFFGDGTSDNDGDGSPDTYGKFVTDWIEYEKNVNYQQTATGDYTPVIEKLIHFTGKDKKMSSYPAGKTWKDANYYLYAANEWHFENGKFNTCWDTVRTPHDGYPIMRKERVYAMQFPYNSIGGTHDPETTWDYWTGKYLLIESTMGPHTINGSQSQTTAITNATISNGAALLIGNASFAEIVSPTLPKNENTTMWALEKIKTGEEGNDTKRDIHDLVLQDNTTIAPTEGVLLANFAAPTGMRARTINYQTGEVTYETIEGEDDNNDPGIGTGIPTIMGDVSLLVVPTEEGLTIIPRTAQRVMLFAADGKMLFNEHLSAEEHINVPTGVYIVRGEYEQVKAIKK